MWNRDITPDVWEILFWKFISRYFHLLKIKINRNLYGTHPFYLSIDEDANALGFFFLNSNAMGKIFIKFVFIFSQLLKYFLISEIRVQPNPAITFITIGGIIDFYLYLGPTPQEVVIQHTDIIGKIIIWLK